MPPREVMQCWREGHREMERLRRREWMSLSDAERLRALEEMYDFVRSQRLHKRPLKPPSDRWQRIKRRWLKENRLWYPDLFAC